MLTPWLTPKRLREDSEDNQDDSESDFAPEDSVDGDSTEVPVPFPVRENGEEND